MKLSFDDDEFYKIVNEIVGRIQKDNDAKIRDKWISTEEAMHMLRITSPTTLQKLRDTMAIRYSQPFKKLILYDADSIDAYLEKHVVK